MADPRRFAEDTSVSVEKSRAEINTLLRAWGCDGLQWTDDIAAGAVTLRFSWTWEAVRYVARVGLTLPTARSFIGKAPRQVRNRESWADREADQRARSLHRVLALKLKADLNCVASGVFSAVQVFLPYIEGADGWTVAEVAGPHLAKALTGSVTRLLEDGR